MINAQHAHIYRIHTLHFIFGEILKFYQYSPYLQATTPAVHHICLFHIQSKWLKLIVIEKGEYVEEASQL
jgi:hypothetical protein